MNECFIGIGENNHFYTLREKYIVETPYGNDVRSYHIKNLSQDPQSAWDKAVDFCTLHGTKLLTRRENLENMLDEIKRATAAEIEERNKRAAAQQKMWDDERAEQRARDLQTLKSGIIPFGRHRDVKVSEVEIGYVQWLQKMLDEHEFDDTFMKEYAEIIVDANIDRLLRIEPKFTHNYFGKVGVRYELTLTVLKRIVYNGYYGTMYILTMKDDENNCFVSMGSYDADVEEVINVKATVKAHNEYQDQEQTMIQRIKDVK